MTRAFAATTLVVSLASCTTEPEHSTYTISRQGVLTREERFDVVHVYGFSDNGEVARQITEFLNESEPNTYSFEEE